jgi:quinoprotein glucose dehydrogenase
MNGSKRYLLLAATLLGSVAALRAADHDWPVYLGDKASTHFSPLEQINRNNVQRLQVAWTCHCGDTRQDDRSQIQCNPLVIDNVLYGTSPQLKLLALDAVTGRELWRFDPFADRPGSSSVGVNRGVVFWTDGKDRRVLFTAGQYLLAVDAGTDRELRRSRGHGDRIDFHRRDEGRNDPGI